MLSDRSSKLSMDPGVRRDDGFLLAPQNADLYDYLYKSSNAGQT
jgi:hypothetical protein